MLLHRTVSLEVAYNYCCQCCYTFFFPYVDEEKKSLEWLSSGYTCISILICIHCSAPKKFGFSSIPLLFQSSFGVVVSFKTDLFQRELNSGRYTPNVSCLLWHLNQALVSSRYTHGKDLQSTGPDKIKFKATFIPPRGGRGGERLGSWVKWFSKSPQTTCHYAQDILCRQDFGS